MPASTSLDRRAWIRVTVVLAGLGVLALMAWLGTLTAAAVTVERFSNWFAPHRYAWYGLPMVVAAFVVLGLAMVPVLLLITATGVAFGPVLGPLYAMAGCLASASMGFVIGRWTGLGRIERVGGTPISRVLRLLERNGTLAVFLLRKVPAPFILANVVAGASKVRYRDFVAGTILGMIAGVVALAGFGHQLTSFLQSPSPLTLVGLVVFVAVPLTFAWFINRALRPPGQPA